MNTSPNQQIISGVVKPYGVSGGRSAGETLWMLTCTLQPWRVAGGAIDERELLLRKQVDEAELALYQGIIQPYQVLHVHAELQPQGDDWLVADLIEIIHGHHADLELEEQAMALQVPVTTTTELFGEMTFDRGLSFYEGQATWGSQATKVQISVTDIDQLAKPMQDAMALWAAQADWDARIRAKMIQELLPLKNESWMDEEEDETELTAEQFLARVQLESINIDPEGEFSFFYDDGDLFYGHVIIVSGTLSDGPTDATIAG
jgi:hypothetical protein